MGQGAWAKGCKCMRALKILMVVMGLLIVAGVGVIIVTITTRLSAPQTTAAAPLDEPAGTRIAQIAASGDRLTMLLQGGGPDRVVVLDLRTGKVTARSGLSQ
jgi:hypothetical protein